MLPVDLFVQQYLRRLQEGTPTAAARHRAAAAGSLAGHDPAWRSCAAWLGDRLIGAGERLRALSTAGAPAPRRRSTGL